jgi:hypothetical protein
MAPTIQAENIYSYQSDAAGIRTLIALASDGTGSPSIANNVVYWDANGVAQTIFTPANKATNLRSAYSRDYMYFTDGIRGDLQKWNFTNGLSTWGLLAPVVAPTLGSPGSGLINVITGRNYFVVYEDPISINYSDLSPISASTGPLTNNNQPITGIPVSTQANSTTKTILATADGGDTTVLYFVTTLPNATTTYTDNTPELTLLENQVFQYTDTAGVSHGVFGNQPPPNGSFPTKHNGRIFMANGQLLQFSKSLADLITATGTIPGRYEEDWPLTNNIDISEIAEQIRGLLSVNQTLYIGTETAVHALLGDSPANFTEPAILFNDTGVMTQNVWQVVFLENTPVGAMWVTPDFRVLGSDYNTYANVGVPIQNTLNTINPAAINNCFAISTNSGAYNFYVLFLATGSSVVPNTLCVYDMRMKKWFIWTCVDNFLSGLFYVNLFGVPRWIVVDANGNIRQFSQQYVLDEQGDATQTGITTTVKTTYLQMGEPQTRKILNELEVITVDPNLLVSVEGASTSAEFDGPNTKVITNAPMIVNAFGDYKVPLAGTPTVDRSYRLTFVSTSNINSKTNDVVLGSFSAEVRPLNRY